MISEVRLYISGLKYVRDIDGFRRWAALMIMPDQDTYVKGDLNAIFEEEVDRRLSQREKAKRGHNE